jgi:hypothetical protein
MSLLSCRTPLSGTARLKGNAAVSGTAVSLVQGRTGHHHADIDDLKVVRGNRGSSLFQRIGDATQPAGLAKALQHPDVSLTFGGGVDKGLPVRCQAEANAGCKVRFRAKFVFKFPDDLSL